MDHSTRRLRHCSTRQARSLYIGENIFLPMLLNGLLTKQAAMQFLS